MFLRILEHSLLQNPARSGKSCKNFIPNPKLPGQVPSNHVDRKGIEHPYLPPRNRTASSFSLDINFSYAASSSKPGPPKGSNKAFPVLVKVSFSTGAAWGSCILAGKTHIRLDGVWIMVGKLKQFCLFNGTNTNVGG